MKHTLQELINTVLHLAGLLMPAAAAKLAIPYGTAWTRFRFACDAVRATLDGWTAEEARRLRAATRAIGRGERWSWTS